MSRAKNIDTNVGRAAEREREREWVEVIVVELVKVKNHGKCEKHFISDDRKSITL
jgi:hypothetical protein